MENKDNGNVAQEKTPGVDVGITEGCIRDFNFGVTADKTRLIIDLIGMGRQLVIPLELAEKLAEGARKGVRIMNGIDQIINVPPLTVGLQQGTPKKRR